jgi:hypothetical protein
VAKRKKKRLGRWIAILIVLLACGAFWFLAIRGGTKEDLGRLVKKEISMMVDRVDELVSAIKGRKGPETPVPKVSVPAPEVPDSLKPPLQKPISPKDKAKLEKILEESNRAP